MNINEELEENNGTCMMSFGGDFRALKGSWLSLGVFLGLGLGQRNGEAVLQ